MGGASKPDKEIQGDEPAAWRVLDDVPDAYPVNAAELDAIEAFLMPLIAGLLADEGAKQDQISKALRAVSYVNRIDAQLKVNPPNGGSFSRASKEQKNDRERCRQSVLK